MLLVTGCSNHSRMHKAMKEEKNQGKIFMPEPPALSLQTVGCCSVGKVHLPATVLRAEPSLPRNSKQFSLQFEELFACLDVCENRRKNKVHF